MNAFVPFRRALTITLAIFTAAASAFAADASVKVSRVNLSSSAGRIRADVFERQDGQPKPAVLVLHGAGGTLLDGPEMRRVARHLAERGNAAYLVRYFERTGTLFARDATMQKHFGEWRQT
ncbi:MAG TPA: hypothetical protein VF551_01600, partial [Chthoniobacterales bacterium]